MSLQILSITGNDNDITEKTTILLFPGEHVIDNRPGFVIKDDAGTAKAVSPSGSETVGICQLNFMILPLMATQEKQYP